MQEKQKIHGFNPWVRKIPWRRKWQLTPVFLPGEPHGQRSLASYSPWGRKESDTTEHTHTHREWPCPTKWSPKQKRMSAETERREYREANTIFHAKRDRQTYCIRTELSLFFILSSYTLWVLTMPSSWFQSFLKSRWTLSFHTLGATPTSFPQTSSLAEADQKLLSHIQLFETSWAAAHLQSLLELAQTHVHRVSDATQPSHPLSSPSPPAFNLSQHQGLFQ